MTYQPAGGRLSPPAALPTAPLIAVGINPGGEVRSCGLDPHKTPCFSQKLSGGLTTFVLSPEKTIVFSGKLA